jgi:hypothetical protein
MLRLLLPLLLVATQAVARGPDRVSFLAASYHLGATEDFNQFNPGVFLTWEGPFRPFGLVDTTAQYSIGVYYNSYSRTSEAATMAVEVLPFRNGALDLFAGIANYPEDGRRFSAHLGDVIPLGGVQLRLGHVFAQAIPCFCQAVDVIFGFGLTFTTAELFPG